MAPSKNTKSQIIESAIAVLKEEGTEGLTLRKVATSAGISLGNLQYHFKDKTALFASLGEHYFDECVALLDAYSPLDPSKPIEKRIRHLILFYLDHLDELTDMCRIFRELWALATRDEAIRNQLNGYYAATITKLEAIVASICGDEKRSRDIVGLLLPYFEGYSITHDAMNHSKKQIADLLTKLSCACLN